MNTQILPHEHTALTCWKEIAQYMGKGVRTVQRWEQEFGLPVRRPLGRDHKSAVLATKQDLDAWMNSAWSKKEEKPQFGTTQELIRTSHELRNQHFALIRQTRIALKTLIDTCNEMEVAEPGPRVPLGVETTPPMFELAQP